jgi:hypothetical protein
MVVIVVVLGIIAIEVVPIWAPQMLLFCLDLIDLEISHHDLCPTQTSIAIIKSK